MLNNALFQQHMQFCLFCIWKKHLNTVFIQTKWDSCVNNIFGESQLNQFKLFQFAVQS